MPGTLLEVLNVTSYNEFRTGQTFFTQEAAESWVRFDPVELGQGHDWFEATVVGPANNFWLSAPRQLSECWVNHDDLGGLQPGSEIFGEAFDLNDQLLGSRRAPPGACCFRTGECLKLIEQDCAVQGGLFQGSGIDFAHPRCGAEDVQYGTDDEPRSVQVADLDRDRDLDLAVANGGGEDLDGSGVVDFGDLLLVLTAWGPCPG